MLEGTDSFGGDLKLLISYTVHLVFPCKSWQKEKKKNFLKSANQCIDSLCFFTGHMYISGELCYDSKQQKRAP